MVIVWRQEGKLSGLFCAVLCATIVHIELHTHMNRPNSSLDLVLSHWANFTVLRFIFVYALFCLSLYIACMCSIVTWWGGPGRTEAWSFRTITSFSALILLVGYLTCKTHSRYDLPYNEFSGTLNPAQSLNQPVHIQQQKLPRMPSTTHHKLFHTL